MGSAILGGVVGAALGIAVQVGLEAFAGIQAPWCAVVIGLLTGLGARRASLASAPGASCARGAIAGLLGLGAIFAASSVTAAILNARGTKVVNVTAEKTSAKADDSEQDAAAATASGEAAEGGNAQLQHPPMNGGVLPRELRRPERSDMWQFIYMAVGAFLAYEFGRGSEPFGDRPAEQVVTTDPTQ